MSLRDKNEINLKLKKEKKLSYFYYFFICESSPSLEMLNGNSSFNRMKATHFCWMVSAVVLSAPTTQQIFCVRPASLPASVWGQERSQTILLWAESQIVILANSLVPQLAQVDRNDT